MSVVFINSGRVMIPVHFSSSHTKHVPHKQVSYCSIKSEHKGCEPEPISYEIIWVIFGVALITAAICVILEQSSSDRNDKNVKKGAIIK